MDAAPRVSTTTGRTIAEIDLTLTGTPVSDTRESTSGTTPADAKGMDGSDTAQATASTPLVPLMNQTPSYCIGRHTAATLTCTLETGT